MKIWEIENKHYPMYEGRGYDRDAYNQHDSEYSKGYEDGYRDAMSKCYGSSADTSCMASVSVCRNTYVSAVRSVVRGKKSKVEG